MRHQQPSATALINRVEVVAGRRLRDLIEEGVNIIEHQNAGGVAAFEQASENAGAQPQARTRNLDVDVGWRNGVAQYDRHANDAFIADRPDLRRRAIRHGTDKRGDATYRKIDVF